MLDELEHFVAVVEAGSFTAAARRVHLSQPALSASVARLEQALGARLLTRGRGGASLTAAGEALLPHAQAARAAVEDGRQAVAEVEGLRAGLVRVGAGATFATYVLPPLLRRFRDLHPGLKLTLREAGNEELIEDLRRGALDLAVVPSGGPPDLHEEPWMTDELLLVQGPQAAEAVYVAFARPSSTRALLDQHFPEAEVVLELRSIAAVKGHVRAGVGRALVSRFAAAADLADGRMVPVKDPRLPIVRQMSLVHRGLERLPPAAAALRALLRGG